jgi:hypothetical protein
MLKIKNLKYKKVNVNGHSFWLQLNVMFLVVNTLLHILKVLGSNLGVESSFLD